MESGFEAMHLFLLDNLWSKKQNKTTYPPESESLKMLFSAAFFFSAVVNFLGMGFSFSSDSDMEDADSELELRVLVTAVFLVLEDDDDFGGLCLPICGKKWNYLDQTEI